MGFKMGRLEKLQKRAVRVISCSKYNLHTNPPFKKIKSPLAEGPLWT